MLIGEIIAFLFIGAFAGVLSGMFGIGGGVIFVPFQILVYNLVGVPLFLQMKLAIGTSLLATACTTFSSARAQSKRKSVDWELIYKIAGGVVVGALIGALFARIIPGKLLEIIFGACLCVLAIYLFFFMKQKDVETGHIPNFFLFNTIGLGIGTVATMLGVSGGFMTVPVLMLFHVPIRKAIGTSSAIGFMVSVTGAIGFLMPSLAGASYQYAIGYLYLPAFLPLAVGSIVSARWGVYLAHNLPIGPLKKIFATVLFIVGILMVVR